MSFFVEPSSRLLERQPLDKLLSCLEVSGQESCLEISGQVNYRLKRLVIDKRTAKRLRAHGKADRLVTLAPW